MLNYWIIVFNHYINSSFIIILIYYLNYKIFSWESQWLSDLKIKSLWLSYCLRGSNRDKNCLYQYYSHCSVLIHLNYSIQTITMFLQRTLAYYGEKGRSAYPTFKKTKRESRDTFCCWKLWTKSSAITFICKNKNKWYFNFVYIIALQAL